MMKGGGGGGGGRWVRAAGGDDEEEGIAYGRFANVISGELFILFQEGE